MTIGTLADTPQRPRTRATNQPATPGAAEDPPAVTARQLSVAGPRGTVFGPIDWTIPAARLAIVTGPAGSGRTTFLLTLTGRMKPADGSVLEVLGRQLPRQRRWVQHHSVATGIVGLDSLDEEVSVKACVREQLAWQAPWYELVRTPSDSQIAALCAPVFGDAPPPPGNTVVHELSQTDNLLLRIALGMLSAPALLAVDEVDQVHDHNQRAFVWKRLEALVASGVTVVASTSGSHDLTSMSWQRPPLHLDLTPTLVTADSSATAQFLEA